MSEPPLPDFDVPEYFLYDKKSFMVARKAMRGLRSLPQVLSYLEEARPPFLSPRDSGLGLDQHKLDENVAGIGRKLGVHGYSDRQERLAYLYKILKSKLAAKPDYLNVVTKFLLEMSQRPTAVLDLEVSTAEYSERPDEELDARNAKSDKELMLEILGADASALPDTVTVSYSSDSELSDWSDDDEDENTTKGEKTTEEAIRKPRISTSFADFSTIADDDEKQKAVKEYWALAGQKAKAYLKLDETVYAAVPLKCQPVIPGRHAIVTKFGEYWEWMNAASKGSPRFVVKEEAVIREIIWQLILLDPTSSQIFENSSEYHLKPGLLTSSLSSSVLSSILSPVQKKLSFLCQLKTFARLILKRSMTSFVDGTKPEVSSIVSSYARALEEIIIHVAQQAEKIERKLYNTKKEEESINTLLQLTLRLKPLFDCLDAVECIHLQNFSLSSDINEEVDTNMQSLKLLSSLCSLMNRTIHAGKFGFLVYIFCRCLHAFLDEISHSFRLDFGICDNIVFSRSPNVKFSDPDFWTNCIEFRSFGEPIDLFSIPCFEQLLWDVLVALKVTEMVKQLNDEIRVIGPPPDSLEVVNAFVENLFHSSAKSKLRSTEPDKGKVGLTPLGPTLKDNPGWEFFLNQANANCSLEAGMLESSLEYLPKSTSMDTQVSRKFLLSLETMPSKSNFIALKQTFEHFYAPLSTKARKFIHRIFRDYNLSQSLKLFREIALEAREDFAKGVMALVKEAEDEWSEYLTNHPSFQQLLVDCYPEGRDNFEIQLRLDPTKKGIYVLNVKPKFPLNLILLDESLQSYEFVSRNLLKIRKCLWDIIHLDIKNVRVAKGVAPNRILAFRFALLHFCSSLRAYIVFCVFAKELNFDIGDELDLDNLREVHSLHMKSIEVGILRDPVMEKIILNNIRKMTDALCAVWAAGMSEKTILLLEDQLKCCWNAVLTFGMSSHDFSELSCLFGPVPGFL